MICKRYSRAYTLIEVLVAMMVLALSLTIIFRIFSSGLRNIGVASEYARAVMVAESVLAATGRTERLEPGETRGMLFDKYHWERSVTAYQADAASATGEFPLDAYYVTVTVDWPARGNPRRLDLSTLQLVTSVAGGGQR